MDLNFAKNSAEGGGGSAEGLGVNMNSTTSPVFNQEVGTILSDASIEGLVLKPVVTIRSPALRS